MDTILTDLTQHKFMAAIIALLVLLSGLAQQGKIQPFLGRFSPWQKTLVLLSLASCGVGAEALSSGLGWTVAAGRALMPVAVALFAHYVGVPTDPVASAQETVDVHTKIAARVAAAKAAAKTATVLFVMTIALFGCNKQGVAAVTAIRDVTGAICPVVLQAADPALVNYPICTTIAEVEAATAAILGAGAATTGATKRTLTQDEQYKAVLAYRAIKAEMKK